MIADMGRAGNWTHMSGDTAQSDLVLSQRHPILAEPHTGTHFLGGTGEGDSGGNHVSQDILIGPIFLMSLLKPESPATPIPKPAPSSMGGDGKKEHPEEETELW